MSFEYPPEGQDPWYEGLDDALEQIDGNANALWANVKDVRFGATGDGTTDDTNAIQAALDFQGGGLDGGGGFVAIPAGHYIIGAPLNIPLNVHVVGAGNDQTYIQQNDTASDVFVISGSGDTPVRAGVHNLHIVGPGSGTGRGVVISALDNFQPAYGGVIDRVYVETMGSHGFHFDGTFQTQINHCDAWNNGGHGFFLDGGTAAPDGTFLTSMQLNTCYANHNAMWGYYLRKATYIAYTSCAADNNTLGGYYVYDSSGVTFTACGAESPDNQTGQTERGSQPYGWKVAGSAVYGTSGVVLTGCYAYGITKIPFYFIADLTPSVGRVDATMIGCRELTTGDGMGGDADVTADFQWGVFVGNGCYVTVISSTIPGAPPASAVTKSMGYAAGGKPMVIAPADSVGNAAGLSFDPQSPRLYPYKDSIQIFSSASTDVPLAILGHASQVGAFLFAHKITSTPGDGGPAITLQPYGQGQVAFGTDQASLLERPPGVDFLSFNKPLRVPTASSVSSLNSTYPAASYAGCVMMVATDKGLRWVMSDGAHWLTTTLPVSGYNQPVQQDGTY